MDYYSKYLKYKNKYFELKGGGCSYVQSDINNVCYIISSHSSEKTQTHEFICFRDIIDNKFNITSLFICEKNIFIFIDNDFYKDKIEVINKLNTQIQSFLESHDPETLETLQFMNISILNLTTNADGIVYDYTLGTIKRPFFRKIINLFPMGEYLELYFKDRSYLLDLKYNTTTYEFKTKDLTITDIAHEEQFGSRHQVSYNKTNINVIPHRVLFGGGGINKRYKIRLINFTDDKQQVTDIKETWWYKFLTDKPYCAYGRFLQVPHYGTCAANTTLNVLFLTKEFKDYLIKSYEFMKHEPGMNGNIQLSSIINKGDPFPKYSVKQIMMILIHNLLISSAKIENMSSLLIPLISSKIKGIYEHKNEDHYKGKDLLISSSHFYSYKGLYILYKLLLKPYLKNKYEILFLSYEYYRDTFNVFNLNGGNPKTARNGTKTARNGTKTARNGTKTAHNGQQTAYNRPQTAYNRPQTAYNRPQTARNGTKTARNGQQIAYNGQQTIYNRPQIAYNRPQTAYNRPQTARNGQQTARNGQQTARNGQQTARNGQQTSQNEQETTQDEQHKRNNTPLIEKVADEKVKSMLHDIGLIDINEFYRYITSGKYFQLTIVNNNAKIIILDIELLRQVLDKDSNEFSSSFNICTNFKINDDDYVLISAFLAVPNHEIAGLNCDGKYYVFDSHGIVVYDDWYNNINNYFARSRNYNNRPDDKFWREVNDSGKYRIKTLIYAKVT